MMMEKKKNDQYQHNGAGTVIMAKEYIKTQRTRKHFNNQKQATILVKTKREE